MKNIMEMSATSLYELQDCIQALYEMIPFTEETDVTWLKNRIRHINECMEEL